VETSRPLHTTSNRARPLPTPTSRPPPLRRIRRELEAGQPPRRRGHAEQGAAAGPARRRLHAISVYVSGMLTVRETLLFAVEFRLPCALSSERKRARVDQLGLFCAADAIIGNGGHHSTSSAAAACTWCVLVMQVAAWVWAACTRSCTTTSLVYASRPLGGSPSGGSSGSKST
jgi:hypothetical protein